MLALALERLIHQLTTFKAITLYEYVAGVNTSRALRPSDDRAAVAQFISCLNLSEIVPGHINSKDLVKASLTTDDGEELEFWVYYRFGNGRLDLDGQTVGITDGFLGLLRDYFGIADLEEALQSGRFFPIEGSDQNSAETLDHNTSLTIDENEPVRLIFYSDKAGQDHNQKFALKYQEIYPNVLVYEATTPQTAAKKIGEARSRYSRVDTVLFPVHGTCAMFDCGPNANPINSATGIGLYPKNVDPGSFGADSGNVTVDQVLSCDLVKDTEFQGQKLYGEIVMSELTTGSNAIVYAANAPVTIEKTAPAAKTNGTIFVSTPSETKPVVWREASPGSYVYFSIAPPGLIPFQKALAGVMSQV